MLLNNKMHVEFKKLDYLKLLVNFYNMFLKKK